MTDRQHYAPESDIAELRRLQAELEAACADGAKAIEQRDGLLRLAKEATNGWACHARTQREHTEIARLHQEIAKAQVAWTGRIQYELDRLTARTAHLPDGGIVVGSTPRPARICLVHGPYIGEGCEFCVQVQPTLTRYPERGRVPASPSCLVTLTTIGPDGRLGEHGNVPYAPATMVVLERAQFATMTTAAAWKAYWTEEHIADFMELSAYGPHAPLPELKGELEELRQTVHLLSSDIGSISQERLDQGRGH